MPDTLTTTEELEASPAPTMFRFPDEATGGGEWDDEGNVITPPEVLDGWHVNYQGVLPDGWEEFAVYPANPVRVWA
jgi:hypothetical protein